MRDEELVAQTRAVIAELPTYGQRRVHAVLKRQALAGYRFLAARPPRVVFPVNGPSPVSGYAHTLGTDFL